MSDIQHIESHTPDLTEENVDKLAALFPDVLTEITDPQTGETKRAIDFDALRDKLGDVAESTRERYQFTWPGKRAAKAEARKPISKTLRPVKERSKDWDTTQNIYIEGDNLDALKILRETYAGKIKLIYIDPPYNTGHDFIYKDNYGKTIAEDKAENGDWDDEGGQLVANPESNGRFHSDWCSMIYPRLLIARDLLESEGLIAISIDDNELFNLKTILDTVFGSINYVGCISVAKGTTTGQDAKDIGSSIDYLLLYAKEKNSVKLRGLPMSKKDIARFNMSDSRGKYSILQFRKTGSNDRRVNRPNLYYPLTAPDGSEVYPIGPGGYESCWRGSLEQFKKWENDDYVIWKKNDNGEYKPYIKYYLQNRTKQISNYWDDIEGNKKASHTLTELLGKGIFDNPKPVGLLEKILYIVTSSDDYVLDFFSGSATTAHAVMNQNAKDDWRRKFILIQLPEHTDESSEAHKAGYSTICEIGEERIRRAGEKIKAEVEAENAQGRLDGEVKRVPDIGFRVLRVDSSCYEDVRKTPAEYTQDALDLDDDNTKEGRSSLDLLFECLPTFQLPYTSSIETLSGEPFAGYTVYSVNGGQLLACFDADIPESLIRGMADFDPKPSYVVVAEKSLPDSAARTNFTEIFKQSANAFDGQTQIRII